jgi:hypothetical protein
MRLRKKKILNSSQAKSREKHKPNYKNISASAATLGRLNEKEKFISSNSKIVKDHTKIFPK